MLMNFDTMDYTLNIVSKCRFFFIFKHPRAPKRSCKIFHGVLESPGKVLDFFVSKRVGALLLNVLILMILATVALLPREEII